MKYVVTGGAGHITKPLAISLLKAGHEVKIISRNPENLKELIAAGATAAIGSVEDSDFLTETFKGAAAVYLMVPPVFKTDNWKAHIAKIGANYARAIQAAGVKQAVLLSSIGAHMPTGCGPVSGLYEVEKALNAIADLNLLILRPGYFYYNFFSSIPLIKSMQIMGGNFGGNDEKLILSATDDIAAAVSDALLKLNFKGTEILYLVSDERSAKEIASVLGKAISQPALPWVEFTDEQMEQGLLAAGLAPELASNYTEMGVAIRTGKMFEEFKTDKNKRIGSVRLEDLGKEFASAYTLTS